MTKEKPIQQVSTEVVGSLTDAQKQELTILGMTILQSKKLDPKNSDHVSQVQAILTDCVYRGLDMQGRVWLSTAEDVSSIFELGLKQRESTVDKLKRIANAGVYLKYVASEEAQVIDRLSPLDSDFSQADELVVKLTERRTAVAKFHQALFEEPRLAPEARELRNSMEIITPEKVAQEEKEWIKNNMLYANLLLNLALYQRADLTVEPKDVAVISDIWKDHDIRDKRQEELVERMKQVAASLGIPEQHIENYTREILTHINVVLASGKITLEELQTSQLFAIPAQAIQDESLEFEPADEAEHKTVSVPKKDLKKARSAIKTIAKMFTRIDKAGYKLNQFLENEYIPFMRGLTPLELIVVYHAGLTDVRVRPRSLDDFDRLDYYARLEEELTQFVPFNTFLEALTMLQIKNAKVSETEESIPELKGKDKNLVYPVIKKHVLQALLEEKFSIDMTFKDVINKLPENVLVEHLETINPIGLPHSRIRALTDLDIQKWVNIALIRGIHAEGDPSKEGDTRLVFEPDSEFLRYYFARMLADKQEAIAKELQHIITF